MKQEHASSSLSTAIFEYFFLKSVLPARSAWYEILVALLPVAYSSCKVSNSTEYSATSLCIFAFFAALMTSKIVDAFIFFAPSFNLSVLYFLIAFKKSSLTWLVSLIVNGLNLSVQISSPSTKAVSSIVLSFDIFPVTDIDWFFLNPEPALALNFSNPSKWVFEDKHTGISTYFCPSYWGFSFRVNSFEGTGVDAFMRQFNLSPVVMMLISSEIIGSMKFFLNPWNPTECSAAPLDTWVLKSLGIIDLTDFGRWLITQFLIKGFSLLPPMKRTPYKSSAFIPDFDNASSIGEHMLLGLLKISLQFKYLESIVRKSWVVKQGVTYIALFSFLFCNTTVSLISISWSMLYSES